MFLDKFINADLQMHFTVWALLFLFLGVASHFDIKERRIPTKLVLIALVIRVVLATVSPIGLVHVAGLVFGYLLIFIPAFIANKPMGGDMKALAVIGFGLGAYNLIPFVVCTLLSSILYYAYVYIRKQPLKDIPFAVFYLIGLVMTFGLSFI